MLDLGFTRGDGNILPQSHNIGPIVTHPDLDDRRGNTRGAFHPGNPAGYVPSWRFVQPPGVGDAPQHVFTTFCNIPLDWRGAGDNPASYLRSTCAPIWQNQVLINQGVPVAGGDLLLTGLYTPSPMTSPGNAPFGGSGL